MARTLKWKLILGSILLVLIMSIAAIMSIREFNKISNSIDTILRNNYTSLEISKEIKSSVELERNSILIGIENSLISKDEIYKANTQSVELISKAKSNITEGNESIHIKNVEKSYNDLHEYILQIIEQGNKKNLQSTYYKTIINLTDNVMNSINDYMMVNQYAIYTKIIDSKVNVERALMPVLVSIVSSILFVFLFLYFLIIYVVKPIKKVTNDIVNYKLNSSNITKEIISSNDDSDDEICEMISEINDLLNRIKAK